MFHLPVKEFPFSSARATLCPMLSYSALLKSAPVRALFGHHVFGVAGNTMQMLALSALVYARTGSALLSAVAYLAGFLPQAIGTLTLMSHADHLPPRILMIGWNLSQAVAAIVLAVGPLPVWAMLLLVMGLAVTTPVVSANNMAVLSDVVGRDNYALARSMFNAAYGVTLILGFAVGGSLLAFVSASGALWCTAALYGGAAVIVRLQLDALPARAGGSTTLRANWRETRSLFSHSHRRALLLAQWLPCGFIVGAESLFVPYADRSAGALFLASATGMLIGDIVVGRFLTAHWRSKVIVALLALLAIPYVAFFMHPGVGVAMALIGLASFGYGYHIAVQEKYVSAVPRSSRGHALGMANSGMLTTQGVAAALMGGTAQLTDAGTAIALAGILSLASGAALWPHLRHRSSGPQPPVEPVACAEVPTESLPDGDGRTPGRASQQEGKRFP